MPSSVPGWRGVLGHPSLSVPATVAVVFLVAGAAQLLRDWQPYGDWAIAELVIRHTDRHLPLSGPYSGQRGYDHPLPLVYAIQWPVYHLLGGRSSAGLAVSVWWSGAWLTYLTWLLARVRATWLGVALVGAVTVTTARVEAASLLLPWNPTLALVPAVALVVVAWRVAVGHRTLLPVMAGLATWCAGAHLGFVPMAVAVAGTATAALVVRTVRRDGREGLRDLVVPAVVGVGVAVVLLGPMIVDLVVRGSASNPVAIVDGSRPTDDTEAVPPGDLGRVLAAEAALPPAWARGSPPYRNLVASPGFRVPVALAAMVVVGVAAHRRRAHDEIVAVAIALVGVVASTAGLAGTDRGLLRPWYLLPGHAASMAMWAALAWSGGRSVAVWARSRTERRSTRAVRPLPAALAPAVALVAALLVVPSLRLQPVTSEIAETTRALADGIEGHLPPGTSIELVGPVFVDGYLTQALALRLDRAGYDVRVPDDHLYTFGRSMRRPAGWEGERLVLTLARADTPPPVDAELILEAPVEHPLVTGIDRAQVWETERTHGS